MTNWITHPTILKGNTVDLIPLEKEHFSELTALAKDKRIWEFYMIDFSNSEKYSKYIQSALIEREKGSQYPFIIFHKKEGRLIGSTRLMDIQVIHKKLEIGSTWLHPSYWATGINLECKLLLLTYCFEKLKTLRVQLKTADNNLRSQKAIEKIGGQYEGTFRNDMVRENNTTRNSIYYSLIAEEWNEKKLKLMDLYQQKQSIR